MSESTRPTRDAKPGLWSQAKALADATPAGRNRYVDFLRAASIMVVVFGHWLVAAPYIDAQGAPQAGHMLALAPWTQWLTLAVQVMPIFFLVGGYANAVAWEAAKRKDVRYGTWLAARLRRLVSPVLPVLGAWTLVGAGALAFGAPAEVVGLITQAALVPTWFLAVYVMVGVLVPLTHYWWKRFGFASFAAMVVGALVTDVVSISSGVRGIGMINYAFVWLAVHQLGYAWRDGRFQLRLVWAAAGAAALALLVGVGPYPLAMVGVPGETLGNTSPPTLALLALGVAQTGLILAFEPIAQRLLALRRVWAGTVLVNGMIMTLYLWHMTAMIAVVAAAYALGGIGLHLVPDSQAWWAARPLWMGAYVVGLLPLVAAFIRFERAPGEAIAVSRRRLVACASLTCAGLGVISEVGLAGVGVRALPTLLPWVGTGLAGFGPLARVLGPAARVEANA